MYSCQPCPTCPDGKPVNQCAGGEYDINNKDSLGSCYRPSSDNNIGRKKGLSGGAIAGIVIGIIVIIVFLLISIFRSGYLPENLRLRKTLIERQQDAAYNAHNQMIKRTRLNTAVELAEKGTKGNQQSKENKTWLGIKTILNNKKVRNAASTGNFNNLPNNLLDEAKLEHALIYGNNADVNNGIKNRASMILADRSGNAMIKKKTRVQELKNSQEEYNTEFPSLSNVKHLKKNKQGKFTRETKIRFK
tara:strand:- start:124 stop:864 length:741 start_codon:yes stop_codon:yes gene_type:complete